MAFDSYAQIVKQEALSLTTTVPEFSLGARHAESGNEYVYVYNAANSSLLTGKYAVINGGTASLSSGYSVTATNAVAAIGTPACVAQNTFATGAYGWALVRGSGLIALDSSEISMNVGDSIQVGIDGGWIVAPVTMSTGVRYGVVLNSAVTTVGTGKARFMGLAFA